MDDYKNIRISDYSYPLPEERIAKYPLRERDHSKLLHLSPEGTISEHHFYDLPSLPSRSSASIPTSRSSTRSPLPRTTASPGTA